ncbi:hypothetical protein HRbin09_01651 [bacterium HR09]|nr:hypothetical protein HRbin09_01651 [bacterium HR09]
MLAERARDLLTSTSAWAACSRLSVGGGEGLSSSNITSMASPSAMAEKLRCWSELSLTLKSLVGRPKRASWAAWASSCTHTNELSSSLGRGRFTTTMVSREGS